MCDYQVNCSKAKLSSRVLSVYVTSLFSFYLELFVISLTGRRSIATGGGFRTIGSLWAERHRGGIGPLFI